MTTQTRRKRSRRPCPLCAKPRSTSGLPSAVPFGIPTHWSAEAALAIFEFIDEMRDIILAVYGTQIQDTARQRGVSVPIAQRLVIPDDELPF